MNSMMRKRVSSVRCCVIAYPEFDVAKRAYPEFDVA